MISITTNLQSMLVRSNLRSATNGINSTIERMTTGFKLNRAKDNAANYGIATDMDTKISAYQMAEDNCAIGIDLISTAEESLELINNKLHRIRELNIQAANSTYDNVSKKAINKEVNALIDEAKRIYNTTEYNGEKIFIQEESETESKYLLNNPEKRTTNNLLKLGGQDPLQNLADGTYSISSAQELAQLATMTNAGLISSGDTFVLASDISLRDFTTGEGWTAIGDATNKFTGTFDGNGYTISDLFIDKSTDYQGLFGVVEGCIKNVNIVEARISGANSSGILVGSALNSTIENCSSTGNITGSGDNIGGLIGEFSGSIENCYSKSRTEGFNYIGGLIGITGTGVSLSLNSCYSEGQIEGGGYLGGLVGCVQSCPSAAVESCYSKTNIEATSVTSDYYTGGLIGRITADSFIVEDCYATGNINVNKPEIICLGGFIGRSDVSSGAGQMNNCYYDGDITMNAGSTTSNVATFLGYTKQGSLTINNCYTNGSMTSSEAGGFVGYVGYGSSVAIKNSYMLAEFDQLNSIWVGMNWAATVSIENSYHNKTYDQMGLAPVKDEANRPVTLDTMEVSACETFTPYTLNLKQKSLKNIGLQIGINSKNSSKLNLEISFYLEEIEKLRNIGIVEDDYLIKVDGLINKISSKLTSYGSIQNRLDSALKQINTSLENLTSTRKTIRDADIAKESTDYIQQQILQNACATLLSTANQTPSIALSLI